MFWSPLLWREKWWPQEHTMTLSPRCLNVLLHPVSQGMFLFETCRKSIYDMYRNVWSTTTWIYSKIKHLWISIYLSSLGFWVEFILISQRGEWCLLVGHPFVIRVLVLSVEERSEFPPTFWHSVILLQVGVDPLTCMVQTSFHPLLGFLVHPRGEAGGGLGYGGEVVLGAVICLAGSTNLGISIHSGREPGTSGGLMSSPRRMASSTNDGEVTHSSSVDFKREASTMSSPLRIIKWAMHLWSSDTAVQRMPVGVLILWCRPAVPGLRSGSSPAWWTRNP